MHSQLKSRPLSMVFSSRAYAAMAVAVAAGFWILFNQLDGLLFFSPVPAFYIPSDAIPNFVLSNITSGLLGIVVAMNVYVFRNSAVRFHGSFLSGSTMSVISSACVGCSSSGFFLVSAFGGLGVATSSIMSQYQLPLRIVSVALLLWALYSVNKRLEQSCSIKQTG